MGGLFWCSTQRFTVSITATNQTVRLETQAGWTPAEIYCGQNKSTAGWADASHPLAGGRCGVCKYGALSACSGWQLINPSYLIKDVFIFWPVFDQEQDQVSRRCGCTCAHLFWAPAPLKLAVLFCTCFCLFFSSPKISRPPHSRSLKKTLEYLTFFFLSNFLSINFWAIFT